MPRVLLVDDDRDIRDLVQLRLARAGYEVLAAGNGPEALGVVEGGVRPDVAVLDVSMPGMDGHALLGELRARPGLHDVPVIFLSAHVDAREVEASRALGAAHVAKPFTAGVLMDAVAAALAR